MAPSTRFERECRAGERHVFEYSKIFESKKYVIVRLHARFRPIWARNSSITPTLAQDRKMVRGVPPLQRINTSKSPTKQPSTAPKIDSSLERHRPRIPHRYQPGGISPSRSASACLPNPHNNRSHPPLQSPPPPRSRHPLALQRASLIGTTPATSPYGSRPEQSAPPHRQRRQNPTPNTSRATPRIHTELRAAASRHPRTSSTASSTNRSRRAE